MKTPDVKCPAAEMQHPVLSSSGPAVECRIEGGLRPARHFLGELEGQPVICCDDYWKCSIWKLHRDISDNAHSTKAHRDAMVSAPRRHVLQDSAR